MSTTEGWIPPLGLPNFLNPIFTHVGNVWMLVIDIPGALQRCVEMARDTWHHWTETQAQRFDHLPGDVQARFMNSGMDGAVVFFFLTLISRRILNKFIEPYILDHALAQGTTKASVQTAKWISTSWMLLVVWLMFSHLLADYVHDKMIFFDLSVPVTSIAVIATVFYNLTKSPAAAAMSVLIPFLVLAPIAVTVNLLHASPFIPIPWAFPYVVACLTATTAIYFILEAPQTTIIHRDANGMTVAKPFNVALKDEMNELWQENWWARVCSAPGAIGRGITNAPQGCVRVLRFTGRRLSDYGNHGRGAANTNPIARGSTTVFYCFLGIMLRVSSFFHWMFGGIFDYTGVTWILSKCPIVGQYVRPSYSGQSVTQRLSQETIHHQRHSVTAPGYHSSEEQWSRSNAPKLSHRVSRRRGDEDQ